ncbi:MAG: glycerol-3-phosphate dehydrogenase/oxidase, partial [Calditrichaeota bacterium]
MSMTRDLAQLHDKQFDVLIVGGGIYGVWAAWDAALRGLSVALIEKGDFGSATSSNSLKIIHGGLRYLQHADFKRMRESILERRALMRVAPQFVHPMKCVMPTYGHWLKGKEVMAVALCINDLVGFDRNRLPDPQKRLPRGRVISAGEVKALMPDIDDTNLTGGAVWYDCQVYNSERMLFSILRFAVEHGAVAANYVEMVRFMRNEDRITGVLAKDGLSGEEFEIRARLVVNNGGPWFRALLERLNGNVKKPEVGLSAAMNLVVKKRLFPEFAAGVWSRTSFDDADAVLSKGSRLLFITPWREFSLVGTAHVPYVGSPDEFRISRSDIEEFVAEVNSAYPRAEIKPEDVTFVYAGLLPMDGVNEKSGDVRLLKNYRIIDHEQDSALKGLVTVVGVKYTTARDVAEKTLDLVAAKLQARAVPCQTAETPIFGGDIADFTGFTFRQKARLAGAYSPETVEHLVLNYGSEYPRVLS